MNYEFIKCGRNVIKFLRKINGYTIGNFLLNQTKLTCRLNICSLIRHMIGDDSLDFPVSAWNLLRSKLISKVYGSKTQDTTPNENKSYSH